MAGPDRAARLAEGLRGHGALHLERVETLVEALASGGDAVVLDQTWLERLTRDDVNALRHTAAGRAGVLVGFERLAHDTLSLAEARGADDWFALDEAPASVARRIVRSLRPSPEVWVEQRARLRTERTLQHVERFARIGCFDYSTADESCVATEALREMLGLAPDSPAVSTTFFERVHPEDQPRVAEAARLAEVTGRPVEVEHRIHRADTGAERHFISVIEAERDADGRVCSLRGLSQDVSEQWESATRRFAEQKLLAIGQFAGGVAHEFNNLLAVVLLNASLLRSSLSLDAEQARDLEDIAAAGHRGKALVHRLQAFSERAPAPDTPFDLSQVVDDLVGLLRRLLREDVMLTVEAPRGAPVRGDPGEIEQVVVNLVMNAQDALSGRGRITLRVEDALPPDAVPGHGPSGADAAGWVRLSVGDDGVGLAPEALPHLFEPFWTTKSLGEGPGLGLATVYGIVRRHGGFVAARAAHPRGTTFEVYLPRR